MVSGLSICTNLLNQPGVYGTQGVASPNNAVGARDGSIGWVDASDNLWLFGGGCYTNGTNICGNFSELILRLQLSDRISEDRTICAKRN